MPPLLIRGQRHPAPSPSSSSSPSPLFKPSTLLETVVGILLEKRPNAPKTSPFPPSPRISTARTSDDAPPDALPPFPLADSSPDPSQGPTPTSNPDAAAAASAGATRVWPRQAAAHTTTTIPAGYGAQDSSPDPGAVVGITLGAVAGFILLLWLIYTCLYLGGYRGAGRSDVDAGTSVSGGSFTTASALSRKLRRTTSHHRRTSHHHHRHHRHHSPNRRETVEMRGGRGPIIVEEAGGGPREVVVEETTRARSTGPPRQPAPPPAARVSEQDEVVVIEEDSPPKKHRSKRSSGGRRRESGGYRDIDPERFAGGDAPFREIRRSSGGSRRR